MYILLAGKNTEAIAERLRNYYSYRGVACLTQNFHEPVERAVEGVHYALAGYDGVHSYQPDDALRKALYEWMDKKLSLSFLTQKIIKGLTERWDELKMHYIVIVHGPMKFTELCGFRDSYCVYVRDNDEDFGTASYPVLSDCAGSDIFDYVIDTNNCDPEGAANLIAAALHDKIASAFKKTIPPEAASTDSAGSPA